MNESKEVLKYCPNFHKIVNFDYLKDDKITAKLIRVYKDYIFSVNINSTEAIQEVKKMKANPDMGKTYSDVDQMMEELLADV